MMLETERLLLRPWEEADAEACYRYAKDPRVGPIAGWPVHTSVENSREVIREVLAVPETYAIVLKESGHPIGSIGLHHNDLASEEDEAELGYWLGVPYWGRGLVPEAAREVLRHAFEDLHLQRVWCGYYEGNAQSARVQEKLGFRFQWNTEQAPVPQMGETRRGTVNCMTKEEWLKLQHIRPVTPEHLESYGALYAAAFSAEPWNDPWDPADACTHVREILESKQGYGLEYAEEGRIVGLLLGTSVLFHDGRSFEIRDLAVHPDFQKRGIARQLLDHCLSALKKQGITRVHLLTSGDGILPGFYEKHGFRREKEIILMTQEL